MEKYIPDKYQKSVYDIDYNKLYKNGIRCILFDLDNTLVPTRCIEIDNSIKELFNKIKKIGLVPIIFTSTNNKIASKFKDELEVSIYTKAYNHVSSKINKILENYKENEIAIIGDEMINDIKFGNEVGITTILVNPLSNKNSILSFIKNTKEKKIMAKLRNNNLFVKGRYYE